MGHYIDIYSASLKRIPRETYEARLRTLAPQGHVDLNFEDENGHTEFIGYVDEGEENFCCTIDYWICSTDPNDDGDGMGWIRGDIQDCLPASAARWIHDWVAKVRVSHRIRILGAGWNEGIGAQVVDEMIKTAHREAGGIIRADYEGYTNEQGHHILWQFSDNVKGPLDAAVLDEHGRWQAFVMELGDLDHRAAFQAGKVPRGAKRIAAAP